MVCDRRLHGFWVSLAATYFFWIKYVSVGFLYKCKKIYIYLYKCKNHLDVCVVSIKYVCVCICSCSRHVRAMFASLCRAMFAPCSRLVLTRECVWARLDGASAWCRMNAIGLCRGTVGGGGGGAGGQCARKLSVSRSLTQARQCRIFGLPHAVLWWCDGDGGISVMLTVWLWHVVTDSGLPGPLFCDAVCVSAVSVQRDVYKCKKNICCFV